MLTVVQLGICWPETLEQLFLLSMHLSLLWFLYFIENSVCVWNYHGLLAPSHAIPIASMQLLEGAGCLHGYVRFCFQWLLSKTGCRNSALFFSGRMTFCMWQHVPRAALVPLLSPLHEATQWWAAPAAPACQCCSGAKLGLPASLLCKYLSLKNSGGLYTCLFSLNWLSALLNGCSLLPADDTAVTLWEIMQFLAWSCLCDFMEWKHEVALWWICWMLFFFSQTKQLPSLQSGDSMVLSCPLSLCCRVGSCRECLLGSVAALIHGYSI